MEVVKSQNVKVLNTVLVSGLTHIETDNVFDFLKQLGPVARLIDVPSVGREVTVIVEFQHEATVKELEKLYLPLDRPCIAHPEVVHRVQSLSSVYSSEVSSSVTETYLSELRDLAKRSSRSFEDILRVELGRIGESVGREVPVTVAEIPVEQEPFPLTDEPQTTPPFSPASEHVLPVSVTPQLSETGPETFQNQGKTIQTSQIPSNLLSTPEVQRVIVEHIVKSSEVASHSNSAYRLKSFSGRVLRPAFEIDYEAWRNSVEFCLNDPTISETQTVRKMVESLSPPASNIVKSLGPKATSNAYLTLLDSAYSTVEDGDELFARFLNTNQNVGEKASDYLQRLHTALSLVIKRKGIASGEANKHLLRQFCRGCWDSSLITNLQLEQRKGEPPSFAELLLLVRTEEDKQSNKGTRMKQHLGITKTKALSHLQTTCMPSIGSLDPVSEDISSATTNDLRKQIADLQAQVAQLKVNSTEKHAKKALKEINKWQKTKSEPETQELKQITARLPKPWYCFKCGEDAHIASACSNDPNPALVEAKKKALREKPRVWESHHNTPDSN